jgi:hypothetical protein
MHSLKEEFHNLFENSCGVGERTLGLVDWLKKAEPYYKKSVSSIKRWFSEVSCCASNLTVNFSTILVGRAGEPVSVFNLDA